MSLALTGGHADTQAALVQKNFPPFSTLRAYSVLPCELTSTVEPRVEFDAVLTTPALAPLLGAAALAADVELELFELLPHAARVSEMARAGTSVFRVGRVGPPLAGGE
jgi:hypothetical protein